MDEISRQPRSTAQDILFRKPLPVGRESDMDVPLTILGSAGLRALGHCPVWKNQCPGPTSRVWRVAWQYRISPCGRTITPPSRPPAPRPVVGPSAPPRPASRADNRTCAVSGMTRRKRGPFFVMGVCARACAQAVAKRAPPSCCPRYFGGIADLDLACSRLSARSS
jgi:hypothetical protein